MKETRNLHKKNGKGTDKKIESERFQLRKLIESDFRKVWEVRSEREVTDLIQTWKEIKNNIFLNQNKKICIFYQDEKIRTKKEKEDKAVVLNT